MTTDEAILKLEELEIAGIKENPLAGISPMYEALGMAIEALKREQWIPVLERLPEPNVPVLVQGGGYLIDEHHGRAVGKYTGSKYWDVEGDFFAEPIAWMPLPEPYKVVEQ